MFSAGDEPARPREARAQSEVEPTSRALREGPPVDRGDRGGGAAVTPAASTATEEHARSSGSGGDDGALSAGAAPTERAVSTLVSRIDEVELPPALIAGRDALARGAWAEAAVAFGGAVATLPVSDVLAAEAWEGLGLASYWQEDAARAIEAHERAHAVWSELGQPARAARMALWLADEYTAFYGAAAVANGWVERAQRLLEGATSSAAHAWLEIFRGHYQIQVEHDPDAAIATARRAQQVARTHRAEEVELVALALEGVALVVQGDVVLGMARLDEASAAAVTRDPSDLYAITWALCYLIQGCDTIRDFRRANEWCARVMAFCERWGLGPVFASCRVRYASVLTWQGDWDSAEAQIRPLLDANVETEAARAPTRRLALVRLGELRRRQGRLAEAESLLDEAGEHRLAILARARVALARGQPDLAIDLADRVLRALPHARAERADALLVRVVAASHTGAWSAAAEDLAELTETAEALDTGPMRGAAAFARGVASASRGDTAGALTAFEDALAHYDRGGVPHEAALVRLELAHLLRVLGRDATAQREARQAHESLSRLRADADLRRAESFLAARPNREAAPGSGLPLTKREIEVLRLVGGGLSNADIARRLHLSPHTVKRHVANILRKLDAPSRAAAIAKAGRLGAL